MKPCDFCGDPQATLVDDRAICDACYIARSSCCADWPEDDEGCTSLPISGPVGGLTPAAMDPASGV